MHGVQCLEPDRGGKGGGELCGGSSRWGGGEEGIRIN